MKKQNKKNSVIFGRLPKIKREKFAWGAKGTLFLSRGELNVSGFIVEFKKETPYSEWADLQSENLSIVERGSGVLVFRGKEYGVAKGYAVKIFPGQEPVVKPRGTLIFLSVQMPGSAKKAKQGGEDLSALKVVNTLKVLSRVYEYEALGQEVFTTKYKPGIGLIRFIFPIDKIPLHIHPYSMRLIRTISGKGYTFAEPNLYEMDSDTFTLFPRGTVHTNGPVPGHIYRLYAFQLPWVDSKIDARNIGGSPKFVRYIGPTPPKKLWKTKPDFLRVMKRLEN